MRVSDSMYWMNMQRNVARRQTDYAGAQMRASTGKKVNSASDDPAAFAQGRHETGNIARAEQYERTIGLAKPVLEQTDSVLFEAENIVRRIRDIAIQGANDTLNASDRNSLAQELAGLHEHLVSIGNTTSGDRFIFAGYKNNVPPYDATGLYSGDTQGQQVEITRGVMMQVGFTGEAIFGTTGNDIFTTITNLQTTLTNNDALGTSALISEVDTRFEQVRVVHSQVGIHLNEAAIAEAVVGRAKETATIRRSSLVDIDAAQAYSDLMRAQTALNAAIQIAGQLPPPGLASRGG